MRFKEKQLFVARDGSTIEQQEFSPIGLPEYRRKSDTLKLFEDTA